MRRRVCHLARRIYVRRLRGVIVALVPMRIRRLATRQAPLHFLHPPLPPLHVHPRTDLAMHLTVPKELHARKSKVCPCVSRCCRVVRQGVPHSFCSAMKTPSQAQCVSHHQAVSTTPPPPFHAQSPPFAVAPMVCFVLRQALKVAYLQPS